MAHTYAALLMLALRLLNALAGTAACAWGAAAHGGTLFLLSLLLPAYQGRWMMAVPRDGGACQLHLQICRHAPMLR